MLDSNHKLILFDIDGTLVLYRDNFPHRLFEVAMLRFFSKTVSLEDYRFSRKTDKNIVTEISKRSGVSKEQLDEKVTEVLEWIPIHLEENVTPNSFALLPNVDRLLVELASQPDTTLALLTGNLPKCAEIKLRQFDLFRHFEFGAYGHESVDRNDLGPKALEQFALLKGKTIEGHHVVIIGDAEPDVLVAKHIGAKSVITLTGRTTREEIEPLQPDYIFDDLSDTATVIKAIYH